MNSKKVKDFAYLFSIGTLNFKRFGDFLWTFKRHLICYRCINILNLCERVKARQRILGSLFISGASQNFPVLNEEWFGFYSRSHSFGYCCPQQLMYPGRVGVPLLYSTRWDLGPVGLSASVWTDMMLCVISSKYMLSFLSTQNETHQQAYKLCGVWDSLLIIFQFPSYPHAFSIPGILTFSQCLLSMMFPSSSMVIISSWSHGLLLSSSVSVFFMKTSFPDCAICSCNKLPQ